MAMTLYIDSIDRSSITDWQSIQKRDVLNKQTDTLNFVIKKYGSRTFVPELNSEVELWLDGQKIFGGVTVVISEKVEAGHIVIYEVQCKDYVQYLDRELVVERYDNQTIEYVINDILSVYAPTFTGNNISTATSLITVQTIAFNRIKISDCLNKIARATNYSWYVDYDKDIHFFPKNAEICPFTLTDTSDNFIYDSLVISDDLSQLRNQILIEGGEQQGNPRTETHIGDATNNIDTFTTANKFALKPTVTVGGLAQTVGLDFIDDDLSFDCMWNYQEKYIRFTAGNIPADLAVIEFEGIPLYPIIVNVPDISSISQYGVYEFVISDKSIESQDEAVSRARAELDAYASTINEGNFKTYSTGFRSGQVLTINSTQRNKNFDVLIQSVTAKPRTATGEYMEYNVTFATLRTLGIIDYLLSRLEGRELILNETETLTNYYPFFDNVVATDTVTPTTYTGPYKWGPDADEFQWNYFVWS